MPNSIGAFQADGINDIGAFEAASGVVPITTGTHINDALYQWASDNGGTGDHINDRMYSALIALGATAGHINDMWFEFLTGQGYTGALSDMKRQYFIDNGY